MAGTGYASISSPSEMDFASATPSHRMSLRKLLEEQQVMRSALSCFLQILRDRRTGFGVL